MNKKSVFFAFALILSIIFSTLNFNVAMAQDEDLLAEITFDNDTTVSKNSFSGTGFTYGNAEKTGYVNKITGVTNYLGNMGKALKFVQDGYTGSNDYNHNMPFIQYSFSNYDSTKKIITSNFVIEAMVMVNSGSANASTIAIRLANTGATSSKNQNTITVNGNGVITSGSSSRAYTPKTWVKLGVQYTQNITDNGDGTQTVSASYTTYVNGEVLANKVAIASVDGVTYDGISYIQFSSVLPGGSDSSPSYSWAMWDNIKVYTGNYDPDKDKSDKNLGKLNMYNNEIQIVPGESVNSIKEKLAYAGNGNIIAGVFSDSELTNEVETVSADDKIVIASSNGATISVYTAKEVLTFFDVNFSSESSLSPLRNMEIPSSPKGSVLFENGYSGCHDQVLTLQGTVAGSYMDINIRYDKMTDIVSDSIVIEASVFVQQGTECIFQPRFNERGYNIVRMVNGNIQAFKNSDELSMVGKYDQNIWNNIIIVIHRENYNYDLYLNGQLVSAGNSLATDLSQEAIKYINFIGVVNRNKDVASNLKVSYRYLKMYSTYDLGLSNFHAEIKSEENPQNYALSGNKIYLRTDDGIEINDFMAFIDGKVSGEVRVYTDNSYTSFVDDYVSDGNIVLVESKNKNAYKAYTVTKYDVIAVNKFTSFVNDIESTKIAAGDIEASAQIVSLESEPSAIVIAVYKNEVLDDIVIATGKSELSAKISISSIEGVTAKCMLLRKLDDLVPLSSAIAIQ